MGKRIGGRTAPSRATTAVMRYTSEALQADALIAGHDPNNIGSRAVLTKLGLTYVGNAFYASTGLKHPTWRVEKFTWTARQGKACINPT